MTPTFVEPLADADAAGTSVTASAGAQAAMQGVMPVAVRSRMRPGLGYPLGAGWDGKGVNFALAAPNAQRVELCLFDQKGLQELQRLPLPCRDDGVWHGYLGEEDGGVPGLVYGYRVYGDYAPGRGHRFNSAKVLLDPYARQVVGAYLGQDAFRGDTPDDTAAIALKAKVVHEPYDWGDDAPPRVSRDETVLCELHVKGYTRLHPQVPPALQGTYAGLAEPAVLDHLKRIGITTVSLLPVHHRADEARLQKAGRSNYWGYSSIGFFAPEIRYWSGRAGTTPVSEFRDMVRALHRRDIEVLLDVVYNHTAETDEFGPTLSFRGIDNALYYHLQPHDLAQYENWTGCGNALDLSKPRVLQMVLDSLRYWVQEMHVDGFRFDLAPVLAREAGHFSAHFLANSRFCAALAQDPVLAHARLIAEPWDIGPDGYQLGNFPARWLEWNDKYRDTMRAFWIQRSVTLGEFAQRFAASSDIFRQRDRLPTASVNFITSHDGFTLQDLVSYNLRHNEDNGEGNRDGHCHNLSWNCGVEGSAADLEILALRGRLRRAMLATLFFSQGTTMLLGGDETGNTQGGNNNAYCQDNEVGWIKWPESASISAPEIGSESRANPGAESGSDAGLAQIAFVQRLAALRVRFPALRTDTWHEATPPPDGRYALTWLAPDGGAMQDADWRHRDCIGILLEDREGGETCLLMFNAGHVARDLSLPEGRWQVLLDSAGFDANQAESGAGHREGPDAAMDAGLHSMKMLLPAQSVVLAVSADSGSQERTTGK